MYLHSIGLIIYSFSFEHISLLPIHLFSVLKTINDNDSHLNHNILYLGENLIKLVSGQYF